MISQEENFVEDLATGVLATEDLATGDLATGDPATRFLASGDIVFGKSRHLHLSRSQGPYGCTRQAKRTAISYNTPYGRVPRSLPIAWP